MHPPASFVPFIMHLRILSFLFFLSALHRFRLPVAFPTPCSHLSAPADLPLSPCLVSHTVLPVLLIQRAVRFLSLFPASLPQPFHRCSLLSPSSPPVPSCVCPCRSLSFVHVRFRALLLSLCFFLSLHPGFPSQWVLRCQSFRWPFRLFPCVSFQPWYSAPLHFFFPLLKFRRTGATSSADLPLRISPSSSAVPLGFRFRFRYSSSGDTP